MPSRVAVQTPGCRNRRLGPDPRRRRGAPPTLPPVTTSPPLAQGPGRAEPSSCHPVQLDLTLVDRGGCAAERLLKVFLFEEGIFAEKLLPITMYGQDLQHPAHGRSEEHTSELQSL